MIVLCIVLRKAGLFQETGKFDNRWVDFELKQSTYRDIHIQVFKGRILTNG